MNSCLKSAFVFVVTITSAFVPLQLFGQESRTPLEIEQLELLYNIGNVESGWHEYNPVQFFALIKSIENLGFERWSEVVKALSSDPEIDTEALRTAILLIERFLYPPNEPTPCIGSFLRTDIPSFCVSYPMYIQSNIPFRLLRMIDVNRHHTIDRLLEDLSWKIKVSSQFKGMDYDLPDNPLNVLIGMKSFDNWVFNDAEISNFERRRLIEIQCLRMVEDAIPSELIEQLNVKSLFEFSEEVNRSICDIDALKSRFKKVEMLAEAIDGRLTWDTKSFQYEFIEGNAGQIKR